MMLMMASASLLPIIIISSMVSFVVVDAQRFNITMENYGLMPMVNLLVGTSPKQHVQLQFDSGSPILWMRGITNTSNGECPLQYDPELSSTAIAGPNVSYVYVSGEIKGRSYSDLAALVNENVNENAMVAMVRMNVTSATEMSGDFEPFCDDPSSNGILGMSYESYFFTATYLNNNNNNNKSYFVTDFNLDVSIDSWFEIGGEDDAINTLLFTDQSNCVELLPPPTKDVRKLSSANESIHPPKPASFLWRFNVTKFKIGGNESSGAVSGVFDDGTSSVTGNFTSIFSP